MAEEKKNGGVSATILLIVALILQPMFHLLGGTVGATLTIASDVLWVMGITYLITKRKEMTKKQQWIGWLLVLLMIIVFVVDSQIF